MARYVIELEKGGCFELEFDPAAPKTAEAFQRFVDSQTEPYQALCLQGRFSGEEIYFPAPLGDTGPENNVTPVHGSVAFNQNPEWSAICVYWGDDIAEKKHYHNRFAKITGDLEELRKVGTRIWQKGGETATLRKLD